MKENIKITDYQFSTRFAKIARNFNTTVHEDCDEHTVKFETSFGNGTFNGINFDFGLSLMMADVELKNDITFTYELGRRHPIHLMFVSEGSVQLSTKDDDILYDLQQNESLIYAPSGDKDYAITFEAGRRIQFITVSVARYLFLRKIECDIETIPETLKKMFKDTTGSKSFYFKSSSEPLVATALLNLFKNSQSGLERKILLEANSLKLITALIKKYRVESTYDGGSYRFSSKDIQQLNKAKNYLFDNLESTLTVKELAQLVGINTNKLQKGFNMLFGKSIRQLTISLKMHLALNLLDMGELSISEIAYKIGYTNKGHFSQLF